MYGGEVAALDWADLDLEKGTLITERTKTGIVRIAVLWGYRLNEPPLRH
jgi:integrase